MSTMSASSFTSTTSDSSNSSKELCVVCQIQPFDLICTCGDKFDFTCIHGHVEQIGLEFEFVQNEVGQRLLQIEQLVEDINCNDATTIVENWKRKRMQDINDIADDVLNQIRNREKSYAEVPPIRVQYNQLCEESHRVVHEQLSSMVKLQREVLGKADELETLPQLLRDDIHLDLKFQSRFDPSIFNQNLSTQQSQPISNLSTNISEPNTSVRTESITPPPPSTITTSNTDILVNSEPLVFAPTTPSDENSMIPPDENPIIPPVENPTLNVEASPELTNVPIPKSSTELGENDEFDAGLTANIQRRNPIVIATNNDRHVATVCCYKNQLLYNDYNQRNLNARLTFIPDLARPRDKQIINWNPPEAVVGGGDDDWIQDIAYSTELQGYLLLNRSRLRLLHDETHEMEEFYQFPDRSMKRVTCNDSYIYLILASGVTGQHGDEIILLNYDKEEKICKTFRDIVLHRNNRITGPLVGEISDIAVNNNQQVIVAYRLERRQEVGVCLYNISNDGNNWTNVKQLLLNECWHNDLSYTPRVEWCEKLNVFILVEYMTGHLIMLDKNGQVKGESRFTHVENKRDAPLNLSISTNDWFCVRYESSINIHRLDDDDRL